MIRFFNIPYYSGPGHACRPRTGCMCMRLLLARRVPVSRLHSLSIRSLQVVTFCHVRPLKNVSKKSLVSYNPKTIPTNVCPQTFDREKKPSKLPRNTSENVNLLLPFDRLESPDGFLSGSGCHSNRVHDFVCLFLS